jgi:UDP:flavonoid glycosyltransferase YjiC (YdhE family)
MLDLMPHLDAVITHGGLNTVCEAMLYGVPLVVAPIKSDQPINADQVAAAGAGVRISFHRGNAQRLQDALRTVLDDPTYRAAAQRVGASLKAAGGAAAAAAHLESLAARR